jgi:hypothetical protein
MPVFVEISGYVKKLTKVFSHPSAATLLIKGTDACNYGVGFFTGLRMRRNVIRALRSSCAMHE